MTCQPELLRSARRGFTIVELLIVVVVIAILAAITVVAYNGMTARATDSRRQNDLASIAKALHILAVENNGEIMGMDSGCGYMGRATGYYGGTYTNFGVTYPSVRSCLGDAGFPALASLGGHPDSYMKLDCALNGVQKSYLLAALTSQSQDSGMIERICNPATSPGWGDVSAWDTAYGMNYYVVLK